MKLTEIAAMLRKTAANMEALALEEGDLDYADEVVLPFVANCLTDANLLRSSRHRPAAETHRSPNSLMMRCFQTLTARLQRINPAIQNDRHTHRNNG